MKISNISCQNQELSKTVSARIDNNLLWFRFQRDIDTDLTDASPFLIAAFIPAMLLGEDIYIDEKYTVSSRLLGNLPYIQFVYNNWNPIFKPVQVFAQEKTLNNNNNNNNNNNLTVSFFSGGVDASYTLLKNIENIDKVILINGFDFVMNDQTWSAMVNKNRRFSESLGKPLIAIETNYKSFTSFYGLARFTNFGSCLACIGQLLAFDTVYISSSATYKKIMFSGAHPLVDSYWSTERTQFIHCGLEADRADKVKYLCSNREAIDNLWVCWEHPETNCGKCPKCIRTYVALLTNDIVDFNFQEKPEIGDIQKIRIHSEEELSFFEEFLIHARKYQKEELARVLSKKILGYKFKQILIETVNTYLPGIQAWRLKGRSDEDRMVDINLEPRYSDKNVLEHIKRRIKDKSLSLDDKKVGTIYR